MRLVGKNIQVLKEKVKGIGIHYFKTCHFDIRIILS